MTHQLNITQVYPSHHVWASNKSKINIHSRVDINKADTIVLNGTSATVTDVKECKNSQVHKNCRFYELNIV